MSTSTSTAPPSALGECVVCGKEASTRCSKCLQGGVNWMFFCSPEHQQLIWSVHKRVCGGPFKWPALKDQERDEMIRLSSYSIPNSTGSYSTGLESMEDLPPSTPGDDPNDPDAFTAQNLFAIILGVLQEKDVVHSAKAQGHLVCNRAQAFAVKTTVNSVQNKRSYSDFHRLLAVDPFGFLAYSQLRYIPQVWSYSNETWYEDFQGRMLNLVGTFKVVQKFVAPTDQVALQRWMTYVAHTVNEILVLARNVIKQVDYGQAKVIVEVYLPALLGECGMELAFAGDDMPKWNVLESHMTLNTTELVLRGVTAEEIRIVASEQA